MKSFGCLIYQATVDVMNDEDEEEDEEDDEEDEKHTKSPKAVTTVGALQKKETRKKVSDSSSDDEESNKEESPVKPVQLEATAPSKNLTPAPMQVDLNNPGKDVAHVEDHGVQIDGRAAVASQLGQKLPLSTSNGDMQQEGLAFLQDLRSTCLKMVHEAKTQSLSISEKLLDEARVKTAQMVDDAKMKSLQIMEELRIVAERLGNVSGQGGRLAGTNSGGWNDATDGLFSGN